MKNNSAWQVAIKKCALVLAYIFAFVLASVLGTFAVLKAFGFACLANGVTLAVGQNKIANATYAKADNYIQIAGINYPTEAEGLMLMDAVSSRVFATHNADKKLPMASTTKIITAIVAIENCDDLDALHEIPAEACGIEGSSIYLKNGEHLSIRDLLYGLMLRSGNDSAVAIATIVAGSVENFMTLANNFCARIGANNTHLVTPNGLHDDDHYTTAEDLAKITAYALKNEDFAQIVATKETNIPNEKGKSEHRDLKNKNKLLDMLDGANGVKTGYTKKAGRCFVGSAKTEDGMQIICVLLNCRPMFQECKTYIQAVMANYHNTQLIDDDGYKVTANVIGSEQSTITGSTRGGFSYPLTEEEQGRIEITTNMQETYTAPIKNGEILGELQISMDKQLIFCNNIYSNINVEDNTYMGALDKVIENF